MPNDRWTNEDWKPPQGNNAEYWDQEILFYESENKRRQRQIGEYIWKIANGEGKVFWVYGCKVDPREGGFWL